MNKIDFEKLKKMSLEEGTKYLEENGFKEETNADVSWLDNADIVTNTDFTIYTENDEIEEQYTYQVHYKETSRDDMYLDDAILIRDDGWEKIL